ncbi:MAG: hypothetical protein A2W35_20275 [Chloroflexi bacterium RBG_16_57_11]|nr:MAG: hypothetical protein A2W35_20275 [Chloroflexi bacterium RBG_16_57_11]
MDNYTTPEEKPDQSALFWSVLTILILLTAVCVAAVFLVIFTNPYSSLNPFPPPTLPARAELPTSTPTNEVIPLPPTWTVTSSPVPIPTETPTPTSTLPPTPTPITLTSTPPFTPTAPTGGYPYAVRQGFPKAIENIYHPELDCTWMGVGGQVVDLSDAPVTGLIVRLGGSLPGVKIEQNSISLTGVALNYGRSGYEFKLADQPIASRNSLWVQLLNQAGVPISERVYFNTVESCTQNLILIDFKQTR